MLQYPDPVDAIVIADDQMRHLRYPHVALSPDGTLTVLIRQSHLDALHRQIALNPTRNLQRVTLAS